MAGYSERYAEGTKDRLGLLEIPAKFRAAFPELALAMGGKLEGDTAKIEISAATLNLFWEGAQLKMCLKPRFDNRVAFGIVEEPVEGFLAIERVLAAGKLGWKIDRNKRTA